MAKKKIRTVAKITINKPGQMTARGRRDVAAWLRRTAADLMKHGDNYTLGTFRGGFHYVS